MMALRELLQDKMTAFHADEVVDTVKDWLSQEELRTVVARDLFLRPAGHVKADDLATIVLTALLTEADHRE